MIYDYCNVKVCYEFNKKDDRVVNVFLHGWGRSFDDFKDVYKGENHLLIDFPPFGKSDSPVGWNIYTYVNMVMCLIRHLKIKKVNLIGHSFGGRIAIILSGMEKDVVEKVVLIDSAGMRPKKSIKNMVKILKYKLFKTLHLNLKNFGSNDYKHLSQDMKKTFVNIVNTYLEDSASLIDAKTLIVFGEKDKETPLYMAKRLKKLIKNSTLVIIENAGHFCFMERSIYFNEILKKFLEE